MCLVHVLIRITTQSCLLFIRVYNLRNACSNILIVKIGNICESGVNGDGYIMSSKLLQTIIIVTFY